MPFGLGVGGEGKKGFPRKIVAALQHSCQDVPRPSPFGVEGLFVEVVLKFDREVKGVWVCALALTDDDVGLEGGGECGHCLSIQDLALAEGDCLVVHRQAGSFGPPHACHVSSREDGARAHANRHVEMRGEGEVLHSCEREAQCMHGRYVFFPVIVACGDLECAPCFV